MLSRHTDLPEEKLLKVIKKEQDYVGAALHQGTKVAFVFLKITRWFVSLLWQPAFVYALFGASVIFFFSALLFPVRSFTSAAVSLGKNVEASLLVPLEEKNIPPLEYYVHAHDAGIFLKSAGSADTGALGTDALKNIALIGILVEEPMQAIIKDKQSGNTFYLKVGQSLGDVQVVDIKEGKIIVEYRGEQFEIYL